MLGHPRRRTETQPRAICIDNIQGDPGVAADLLSRLLSHRTQHHTYRRPADCQFERLLLGGQSPLASVQRFVHARFRVHIVDYHCFSWGLVVSRGTCPQSDRALPDIGAPDIGVGASTAIGFTSERAAMAPYAADSREPVYAAPSATGQHRL